jgi:hypothetical protein
MLFLLISEQELFDILLDLGHTPTDDMIQKNIEYYESRTRYYSCNHDNSPSVMDRLYQKLCFLLFGINLIVTNLGNFIVISWKVIWKINNMGRPKKVSHELPLILIFLGLHVAAMAASIFVLMAKYAGGRWVGYVSEAFQGWIREKIALCI